MSEHLTDEEILEIQEQGATDDWGGGPARKAKAFWPSAKRLMSLFRTEKLGLAVVAVMVLVAVVFNVWAPRVLGRAMDVIFGGVVSAPRTCWFQNRGTFRDCGLSCLPHGRTEHVSGALWDEFRIGSIGAGKSLAGATGPHRADIQRALLQRDCHRHSLALKHGVRWQFKCLGHERPAGLPTCDQGSIEDTRAPQHVTDCAA